MASEINICNLALSLIGKYSIQSLTESSKEARQCSIHYAFARDEVLEDHDWGFASKRVDLAESTASYTNWDYAYGYPSDALAIREILDEDGSNTGTSYDIDNDRYVATGKVKYKVESNSTLNQKIILTNKESAEARYTARVTDANMFTNKFIKALSLNLASRLAIALKADKDLKDMLFKEYLLALGSAETIDSNENEDNPNEVSSFQNARN